MICSDFHPINKIINALGYWDCAEQSENPSDKDYFSTDIKEVEVPYARFYDDARRRAFPKCIIRRYTLSEILNAALHSGFRISGFDEHPSWTNAQLPGEFTLLADKVTD